MVLKSFPMMELNSLKRLHSDGTKKFKKFHSDGTKMFKMVLQ